jgi:hypothetical protein
MRSLRDPDNVAKNYTDHSLLKRHDMLSNECACGPVLLCTHPIFRLLIEPKFAAKAATIPGRTVQGLIAQGSSSRVDCEWKLHLGENLGRG